MNITLDITPEFMNRFDKLVKESVEAAVKDLVVEDRIMTKKEVAEFIQVSIPTLEGFMREGMSYFQRGQVIRFLHSDVVGWVRQSGS